MKMNYFVLGTNNMQSAVRFYDELFEGCNMNKLLDGGRMTLWNGNDFMFALAEPFDGKEATVGNGSMVGFNLGSSSEVERLYNKALEINSEQYQAWWGLASHQVNVGGNLKLSKEPFFHGFKAMQISLSSLSADVIKNTTAASIHSRPTESLNQDKVSMGTTAANDFAKMIPDLHNMLAIAFIGMAQAVDIRGESEVSPHLKNIHDEIRKIIKPLLADRRMDGDIKNINVLIKEAKFI